MDIVSLFPLNSHVDANNHLIVGGCDAVSLAHEFGTPLYVFDEATLRTRCAEYRREFERAYPDTLIVYASKAGINRTLASLLNEEGLGLDVVSGGELSIARSAGFPMDRVYLHGNNKSAQELEMAIRYRVARVVVDNFFEISLLSKLTAQLGETQDVLLRLNPGIEPHTHAYITTGAIDSKFGFPIVQAEAAVSHILSIPALHFKGFHFHIGSQIFELDVYRRAVNIALQFVADIQVKYGLRPDELNVGGGLAITYTTDSPAPTVAELARTICPAVLENCASLGIEPPRLVIEPGRSIVGQAGVALYTVGATKTILGVRKYVSVDGGMADNIRPALYQAKYEAAVANRVHGDVERVTIAGKFCESGDILIRDIELPLLQAGDIIAIPSCGAYCIPMASNYNSSPLPAIIMVKDARARIIRKRQSYDDLMSRDVLELEP